MRRPALLPRDAGGEPWLGGLIAVLCFLACLAAMAASAADRAAQGWQRELRGEATVLVRPRVDETGPAAAARAAETLSGLDGVEEASAMPRESAAALLRPWLGEAALQDLPLPHLVTVRLDPAAPASAPTLSRALAEAGLDATVDDHSLWRGEVERAAGAIGALAAAAFLLIAGAAAAGVAYAVRAGMAAQAQVIAVLRLNGATDALVAGLFLRRYAALAFLGGAAGTATALAAAAALRAMGGGGGLTPALPLAWSDLWLVLPCPLAAALIAAAAAWLAVRSRLPSSRRNLSRRPRLGQGTDAR